MSYDALKSIERKAVLPKPFLVCGEADTDAAKLPTIGQLRGEGVDANIAAHWAEKGYVIGWFPARLGLVVLDDDREAGTFKGADPLVVLPSLSRSKGAHYVFRASDSVRKLLPRKWRTLDGERQGEVIGRLDEYGVPKVEYACFALPVGGCKPIEALAQALELPRRGNEVPIALIERAHAVGRSGASLERAHDLARAVKYPEAAEEALKCLETAPEGGRNDLLYATSCFLGRLEAGVGLDIDESALVSACEANGIVAQYGLAEVVRQRDRGLEDGRGRPWEGVKDRTVTAEFLNWAVETLSEAAPAPPVKVEAAPDTLYDPDGSTVGGGTWYTFREGKGWDVDREARTVLRRAEASGEAFGSRKAIDDYLAVASIRHSIDGAVPWNRVETHLGLPEGKALSLKTGNIVSQKASFYIRRAVTVEPDFSAPPDLWLTFLKRVLPDPEMRNLLREALAYTLTGFTDAQLSFWCFGPAASGKSTVADTIRAIFGSYAHVFPDNTMVTRFNANPAAKEWRSDLGAGVRFAMVDEVESRDKLNERDFKTLVAGSAVTERRLYKGYTTFAPTAKVWFFGNTIPKMDVHEALTRRILAIPFSERIPEEERDENVKHRLNNDKAEHARILAWIVEKARTMLETRELATDGTYRWFPSSKRRPEVSQAFVRRMMVTNDALQYFLHSRLEVGSRSDFVATEDIRERLLEWADANEHAQPRRYSAQGLSRRIAQEVGDLGGVAARRREPEGQKRGFHSVRWA